MKKPNIIFINTDQQSYDAMSISGNRHLKTPNIDEIYANGFAFDRSYATNPVCVPARSSWATGLYTSELCEQFNGGCMPEDIIDIGQLLNANSYNCVHAGKWHVDGRDVRKSFHVLYYGNTNIGASGAEYFDTVTTHSTLDFLANYDDEKPFYLQLGYINPHDICEFQHNYEEKDLPDPVKQGVIKMKSLPSMPDNFGFDPDETMVLKTFRRSEDALIHSKIFKKTERFNDNEWRNLKYNYYRFIEKADMEIGHILSYIENSRYKDNTIIIYTRDHGDACGSHRMFQKFTCYEESVRVPLVISSFSDKFNIQKGESDKQHLVSGVDLFPTICDYAGVEIPLGVQGASLRPLVEQKDIPWREFVYIENNYWEVACVTDRYKYITEYIPKGTNEDFTPPNHKNSKNGYEVLYDFELDPGEMVNRASYDEYRGIKEHLRKLLFSQELKLKQVRHTEERGKAYISMCSRALLDAWQNDGKS